VQFFAAIAKYNRKDSKSRSRIVSAMLGMSAIGVIVRKFGA
jgi:hypothetical protein